MHLYDLGPGGTEWILIILAVLIFFGGRKIPEFMRGLGKGIREFNDAKTNVKKEIEEGMNEKETKAASPALLLSHKFLTTIFLPPDLRYKRDRTSLCLHSIQYKTITKP